MSVMSSSATISCTSAGCNFKTTRRDYLQKHVKNRHRQRPDFNCEFCDKIFTTKIGCETHLKRHTGELLPCTVCDFKTAYVDVLKKHTQKHELGNKGIDWPKPLNTHKCQLCDYLAPSEARVLMHARIHFDDLPYKCSIPGCGHRTKWKGNLKQHEDRHDPIKSTKFKCPMCPKRFCTEYQVTRHVQTHTQERTRECPDCDYKAASLIQVKRHQQRHHFRGARSMSPEVKKGDIENQRKEMVTEAERQHSLGEGLRPVEVSHHSQLNSFPNSEIGNDTGGQSFVSHEPTALESFPSKPIMDKRTKSKRKPKARSKPRRIYNYPKNKICSVCGYATSRSLKDHMRIHSDDKPFHCQAPNCNFQSRWAISLEEHTKRLHTPKKYICPLTGCDFESKDPILSRKHRRLHKLPPKKNLKCPLCPKKYGSKVGLDYHVLCHTGEKALKCELCEYKGKTSSSVTFILEECMHISSIAMQLLCNFCKT